MNINIKWLKRRTKKVEDKYKMDAYLRTYSIDKDGNNVSGSYGFAYNSTFSIDNSQSIATQAYKMRFVKN